MSANTIMSKNIVFEGWLTKSPPTKRIWRTKWRRRWFALRQSGELPGQYFLDYYADRNCRRLKGTINLDLCEQVDAGLHMERSGGADPKLRGSVFTIQTQSRTYHLEADCEAEMEKWVDAICRVCGLRATDDSNEMDTYQNTRTVTATNEHYDRADTTGPYIPISECITGVRAQDAQRAFKSERKRVARSSRTRSPCERVADSRPRQIYSSQPQIRVDHPDPSDDSMSDDERSSMNFSLSNIGPPVPPRPPMTLTKTKRVLQRETHNGPRVQEPQELLDHNEKEVMEMIAKESPWHFVPQRKSVRGAPSSSGRKKLVPYIWTEVDYDSDDDDDDDDEFPPRHLTLQYCNLPSLPPAVDRALKPRHSSHSIGHVSHYDRRGQTRVHVHRREEIKPDVLQYLDLDLHTSRPVPPEPQEAPRPRMEVNHGKSLSATEADSAYKTVDFLKTEAFNITRKDAEASRSNQQ